MILLIDNYDSFSYNLYQLVGSINPNIKVVRNDALTVNDVATLNPEAIILSPGPRKPKDAGICIPIIQELSGRIPLLGVCLGHQAIFEALGGSVDHAKHLMHGKSSEINIDNASPLFKGLPQTIQVARYHSLSAQEKTLPSCLRVIGRGDDEVMAIEHCSHPTYGVQFHPESIMTPDGLSILRNFLSAAEFFKQNQARSTKTP